MDKPGQENYTVSKMPFNRIHDSVRFIHVKAPGAVKQFHMERALDKKPTLSDD